MYICVHVFHRLLPSISKTRIIMSTHTKPNSNCRQYIIMNSIRGAFAFGRRTIIFGVGFSHGDTCTQFVCWTRFNGCIVGGLCVWLMVIDKKYYYYYYCTLHNKDNQFDVNHFSYIKRNISRMMNRECLYIICRQGLKKRVNSNCYPGSWQRPIDSVWCLKIVLNCDAYMGCVVDVVSKIYTLKLTCKYTSDIAHMRTINTPSKHQSSNG